MGSDILSIIVVTYKNSPFLAECVNSLEGCKYPIYLMINPDKDCPYDPGAFYYAKEHNIQKFIILHDSMVVKDKKIFDMAFELDGLVSIGDNFLMCLGKYELDKLPELPEKPRTKYQAVMFETDFLHGIKPDHTLCPEFKDRQVFVEKHGLQRMVLENEYLIKYKSTWKNSLIRERE